MPRRPANLRTGAVLIVIALVVAVFLVRLVDVQLVSAAGINAEAEGRRGVTATIWGTRGDIESANGVTLADTVDRFDITASPRNATGFERIDDSGAEHEVSYDQAIEEIAAITGQKPDELRGMLSGALEQDAQSNFAYLTRMVTLDVYERVKALGIPWVYFERHPARTYPNGAIAGNLVGFLGSDGSPLAGFELGQDACLKGVDGQVMYERGADGIAIPGSEVVVTQTRDGGDLVLTIDSDLQWKAQQLLASEAARLGSEWGQATIMDAKTGEILALAEYPSVDPNNPSLTDPEDRGSRAFTSPFEPGSTIKPLTAGMVFDRGLGTIDEWHEVRDSYEGADFAFRDDHPHEPQRLTTAGILAYSSNVGIAQFGERLAAADRYGYLLSAGFGSPTEAGFLGEEAGTVHDWQDWDPQTSYATMFGQALEVTGPQIASVYQMIANGGVREPVRLVAGCRDAQGVVQPAPGIAAGAARQVLSPEAAAQVLTGLEATAQSGSVASVAAIPGYRIGLKTGTAQFSDGQGGYVAGKYIVSIAGIAPIDDPQIVVSVTLSPPATMNSSTAVAPVWHDLMSTALQYRGVAPSPEPWPQITVEQ